MASTIFARGRTLARGPDFPETGPPLVPLRAANIIQASQGVNAISSGRNSAFWGSKRGGMFGQAGPGVLPGPLQRRFAMRPDLSLVIPLRDEQDVLPELARRVCDTLDALKLDAEILFIDDGSRDRTPMLLSELARRDARFGVLTLSRNFGHQPAVTAGLDHARGRAVIVMDGDLQDPPELIPAMLDAWHAGNDVVYAVRRSRQEPFWLRLSYQLFYRVFRRLSDLDAPLDSGDFCLMDRRVVRAINALPERVRFVRGLRRHVGFRQIGILYDRDARAAGRSKYSLRSLVRLATDGLVSFSSTPLRIATYVGLITASLAVGLTGWVLVDALATHSAPPGWASTLVVVLFLGAVQLVCLGIIGEYLRVLFLEVKQRPPYHMLSRVRPGAASAHTINRADRPESAPTSSRHRRKASARRERTGPHR